MKTKPFKTFAYLALLGCFFLNSACSDDNDTPEKEDEVTKIYTLAQEINNGDRTATAYLQGFTDLTTGSNINVASNGFEIQSTNAARLFSVNDGFIYNMDYGSADISKLSVGVNTNYNIEDEAAAEYAIGTAYPRWKAISSTTALIHNVSTETLTDENGNYLEEVATARIMSVNLEDLSFGSIQEFTIPKSSIDTENDYYTFRIDAPVVSGDKVYYGMQRYQYDADGNRIGGNHLNTQTLVLDYPSLENPVLVESTIDGVVGATNGYRTPAMHLDENGDVYQLTGAGPLVHKVEGKDTYFLKLSNGDYDNSYSFNLDQALSRNIASTGWFYAGDGIGYVTYYDVDEYNATNGDYENIYWGVARVDLINKTAIELNVPADLYLLEYQNVVIEDGKVYMVLAPIGGSGNVYIFDSSSESADGFEIGASVTTGASSFYIGVY